MRAWGRYAQSFLFARGMRMGAGSTIGMPRSFLFPAGGGVRRGRCATCLRRRPRNDLCHLTRVGFIVGKNCTRKHPRLRRGALFASLGEYASSTPSSALAAFQLLLLPFCFCLFACFLPSLFFTLVPFLGIILISLAAPSQTCIIFRPTFDPTHTVYWRQH
ncbi:hypothetical protein B0H16DRAFT_1546638 [Mycena metata]|uniref:Uncharacterized protein n=1 Tax=Mycena metata TaxID=1033252 RepID=A0AAD7IZ31_9AGAR|nr:hypothetical protein B0H16DRAFT_1546638 [Mycena metata]